MTFDLRRSGDWRAGNYLQRFESGTDQSGRRYDRQRIALGHTPASLACADYKLLDVIRGQMFPRPHGFVLWLGGDDFGRFAENDGW